MQNYDKKEIGKEIDNSNMNNPININELENKGKQFEQDTQIKIENIVNKEEKNKNDKQIIDKENLKNKNTTGHFDIINENKIEISNNFQSHFPNSRGFEDKKDKENKGFEGVINEEENKVEDVNKNSTINVITKVNNIFGNLENNNNAFEEDINKMKAEIEGPKIIDTKTNKVKEKKISEENDKKVDKNNKTDDHEKIFINNKIKENANNSKIDKEKENNNIINKNKGYNDNQNFSNVNNNIKNKNINNNQDKINDDDNDSSSQEDDNDNGNINYYQNDSEVCGIKNLGNNCYLNSGLQILASSEELVKLLNKEKYDNLGEILKEFKKALNSLLRDKIYNPKKFIDCFCKLNKDFIKGTQNCSQDFIRTILRNINKEFVKFTNKEEELITENKQYPKKNTNEYNQYEKYIKKIFPESKVLSLFSVITKSHSFGDCSHCKHLINDYSFSYYIDQNMYLDEIDRDCNFSDVLYANLGKCNNLTMDCPQCNEEINIKEENKIIKLPDILIFTLERYQGTTNNINIIPDSKINMKKYIDLSLNVGNFEYELFAINIRLGSSANFGHEICQVKRGGKWYEINDRNGKEIKKISHFNSSYGLFYRKIVSENIKASYIFEDKECFQLNNNIANIIKLKDNPNSNNGSYCGCF
jgi:ubiquitin C-terminal hydrolase